MATTYHLALATEWAESASEATYAPPAFEREGFVHCTDGPDEMVATANRHYRDHPGPFIVLEVDLASVDAPVVYEDERRIYPHIHGPIARAAVVAERLIDRAGDGTFLRMGDASRP